MWRYRVIPRGKREEHQWIVGPKVLVVPAVEIEMVNKERETFSGVDHARELADGLDGGQSDVVKEPSLGMRAPSGADEGTLAERAFASASVEECLDIHTTESVDDKKRDLVRKPGGRQRRRPRGVHSRGGVHE